MKYSLARSFTAGCLAIAAAMLFAPTGHAAVFRCVDANGTNTYSDKPCAPTAPDAPSEAAPKRVQEKAAVSPVVAVDPVREAKGAKILQMLQLASAAGTERARALSLVNLVAPDLVKDLDSANPAWTPQHPKWRGVLEFVKSDLRNDADAALRASSARTNQAVAREYATHAKDADMDAMLQFLSSAQGARYIAFQNELKSILNQALDSLMAQEPITEAEPTAVVLKRRQDLLALGFDARIAADGGGPAVGSSAPGSAAVLGNTARREGNALDTLYGEYEGLVPAFAAFNESPTAKHFFVAVEPALRTHAALTSDTADQFASVELSNYEQRWRAYYGPPVRSNARTVSVVRNASGTIVTSRTVVYNGGQGVRESAALQCEQRDTATYTRTHRATAGDYQGAIKAIQNKCRADQNLPPI